MQPVMLKNKVAMPPKQQKLRAYTREAQLRMYGSEQAVRAITAVAEQMQHRLLGCVGGS